MNEPESNPDILLELKAISANGLQGFNLEVKKCEIIVISGSSGSGKSLMLRAVADLIPHEGQAYLQGQACDSITPTQWRKQVGMLPAESAWWSDRVGDHFSEQSIAEADKALSQVGLSKEVFDWSVSRCSTGEKQRLALLRLLCNRPRVLLLDEPTASLDPAGVNAVEELVQSYIKEYQAAVIWVSHDPQQISRVASRHFRIDNNALCEEAL